MYIASCSVAFELLNNAVHCPDTLSIIPTDALVPQFTMADIDLAVAGIVFAGSFITIGMFAVAAFGLGALLKFIRSF